MNGLKKFELKDQLIFVGLLFIIISLALFILPEMITLRQSDNDSALGFFFVNYGLAALYMILLIVKGWFKFRWRFFKNNIEPSLLLLILYLISAFSLNRALPVFEESTQWVCVFLTTLCVTFILLIYRAQFPAFFQKILYLLLGSGLVLYAYFSIYLIPMYAIGFVASFILGISVHVFTPVFFFIFTILFYKKIYKENKNSLYPFLAGVIIPVIIAISFVIKWQHVKTKAEHIMNEGIINESALPLWVKLSQHLPKNELVEKALKADLVYSTPSDRDSWGWRIPSFSFETVRKHDPLVMTAVFLRGKINLSEKEKIKILESMYDARHQAQERLWSGDKLETSNIISNIKIFPEYRMAYTEKTLSISNKADRYAWRNDQEAIYTFHLPEGGVATSLSLWINGREEKGVLTTKAKAAEAYNTIVGKENRDPSVLHWQEGNTVTVRIFPCTPEENRRFKIGITAPLRKKGHQLIYENIYFDGPSGRDATETIQMQFTTKPESVNLPFSFSESGNHTFKLEKEYEPYWETTFKAPALSSSSFSFDGCSYKLENYVKQYEHFLPKTVYLDINSSWSQNDLSVIWELIKQKDVYIYQNELIKLTADNKEKLIEELTQLNFSLFPLDKIRKQQNAIFITKSALSSPNLKDLKGSEFSENLSPYLKKDKQLRVFNIGTILSPYLKTLKELRKFIYDEGEIAYLSELLQNKKFCVSPENDTTIAIQNAGILIKELNENTGSDAPDHLLRLFTYNHLMKEVSPTYFNDQFISNNVIAAAQKAYIVSPVSSLIVLETQKDYERFGIEESKNSLKNASMKSSGSVPEPHEWLLIGLTIFIVLYLHRSGVKQKATI